MAQLPSNHIAEDLKLRMSMRRESRLRLDPILIHYPQGTEGGPERVILTGKGKGEERTQPSVMSVHTRMPGTKEGLRLRGHVDGVERTGGA